MRSVSLIYLNTIKYIAAVSILCTIINCKDVVRKNEINKVVLFTGSCFGTCPSQIIEMDSSLIIKYRGIDYTDKIGFYQGSITSDLWDTLNIKLEDVNYKQLDTAYFQTVDDWFTEIYIYSGNEVKHIQGQEMSLPPGLIGVYKWILRSSERVEWTTMADSLKFSDEIDRLLFETKLRSLPIIEEVKFTEPPIEK